MIIIRSIILLLLSSMLLACGEQLATDTEQKSDDKVVTNIAALDGQKIYDSNCLACHAEGPGHPGTMRLAIRVGEDKSVLTKRRDLQPDFVKTIVRQGILLMPPFRPSEITDGELDALAEYLAVK